MKKVIIAIIGIIISLLFCSCQEITKVGDVYKYPIYPSLPDPKTTIVKPTSTEWFIVEGYVDRYNPASILSYPWGKKIKFLKNDIFIDTLTQTPVLSLDVQIESTLPDVSFTDRKDRVASFRFKLDSIELKEAVFGQNELSISNWFELYIKTLSEQKIYYLNQDDLLIDWWLLSISPGTIAGDFRVFVPLENGYQTRLLTITFNINYPYKKESN